jgi:hypothetical protein
VAHTGGGPVGWGFASFASNARVAGDPQAAAYANILDSEGASTVVSSGYTIKTFGDLLAIVKLANRIGFNKLTPAALSSAIKSWHGPGYAVAGPFECGYDPSVVSVCGKEASESIYTARGWKDAGNFSIVKIKK